MKSLKQILKNLPQLAQTAAAERYAEVYSEAIAEGYSAKGAAEEAALVVESEF